MRSGSPSSIQPTDTAAGAHVPDDSQRLLTATEVAALLGVPKSWVYEQSRLGRIPTVTLGRYRRYRLSAIRVWLAGLEESGMRTVAGS